MKRISKQIKIGTYVLSIQRSDKHYCDEKTYELAVIVAGKIAVLPELAHLYNGDTVIGWANDATIQEITTILNRKNAPNN